MWNKTVCKVRKNNKWYVKEKDVKEITSTTYYVRCTEGQKKFNNEEWN